MSRDKYPVLKSVVTDADGGADAVEAMRKAHKRALAEGTSISLAFARIIERWLDLYAIPEYSDAPEESEVVDANVETEVDNYNVDDGGDYMLIMSPAQAKAYRELGYSLPEDKLEEHVIEVEGEM